MKFISSMIMLVCLFACEGRKSIQTSEDIQKSISEAEKGTTAFEGRFIKIEQINHREHYLYLKDENDSIIRFLTIMPLDDHEIRLLRKTGNNIMLTYLNFYNPVRKLNEKMVKSMTPVYGQ